MRANVKTAPTKRICSWSRTMCVRVCVFDCNCICVHMWWSVCACVLAGDCVCSFHFICMAGAQSVSLEF